MRPILFLTTIILLSACASTPTAVTDIYLLRHAEKRTGPDPSLTVEGVARAGRVAQLLADKNVRAIYSTDYRRTRDTARPIAELAGINIELYDPGEPQQLVERLKNALGAYVVVGHSNTIPELVDLLGGEPGAPMTDNDYDRLYHLQLIPMGTTTRMLDTGQ